MNNDASVTYRIMEITKPFLVQWCMMTGVSCLLPVITFNTTRVCKRNFSNLPSYVHKTETENTVSHGNFEEKMKLA